MKYHYVCTRELTYNGHLYREGQPWLPEDGGVPPPVGVDWVIQQVLEGAAPGLDSNVTGASTGPVGWKPQPGRPQATPLTPEEKERLKVDPYANLDATPPPPPAPDPPAREKKKEPVIVSAHLLMTDEERADPYGLKARAAATTAELQADPDKEEK